MPPRYNIALCLPTHAVFSAIEIYAADLKDAEAVGNEMAQAILPILQVHYQSLDVPSADNIKVIVSAKIN